MTKLKLPSNLKTLKNNSILLYLVLIFLTACNSNYSSKKNGYYKIDFPEHAYQLYNNPDFPYQFEYPVYANIVKDSTFFDRSPENPFWVNVDFPQFEARIFLSYKIIGGKAVVKLAQANGGEKDSITYNDFDKLRNDAFTLTNKNNVVASSIKDSLFVTPNKVTGIFFSVAGNAATASQFFVTDTTKNFLRGALYFNATPNADSLAPVQQYLKEDMLHLINSFKWNPAFK